MRRIEKVKLLWASTMQYAEYQTNCLSHVLHHVGYHRHHTHFCLSKRFDCEWFFSDWRENLNSPAIRWRQINLMAAGRPKTATAACKLHNQAKWRLVWLHRVLGDKTKSCWIRRHFGETFRRPILEDISERQSAFLDDHRQLAGHLSNYADNIERERFPGRWIMNNVRPLGREEGKQRECIGCQWAQLQADRRVKYLAGPKFIRRVIWHNFIFYFLLPIFRLKCVC